MSLATARHTGDDSNYKQIRFLWFIGCLMYGLAAITCAVVDPCFVFNFVAVDVIFKRNK